MAIKNEKQDLKQRIIRFLTKSDIVLNSEEEKILARWEHVDHLMRQNMQVSDIVLKHTHKYGVSKFTADNDIYSAQEVFARSRKINKKYVAHLHLQDIQSDLTRIRRRMFLIEGEERTPDEKEIIALSKLHDSFTKQLSQIPEDIDMSEAPRPVIIYELKGTPMALPMDITQALLLADKLISNASIEDIDHEDVSEDEPT